MPLTTDWTELQAAITEWVDGPDDNGRTTVVLSLPVSGTTAPASTAVAASLLRGLVNDYFESYDTPVEAQWVSISSQGPTGFSLAVFLIAKSAKAFLGQADEIRTAIEQALEDLPKNLARPDAETAAIIDALKHAKVLEDDLVDA